ncbi:hypothetical protein LXA43DRAFT_429160 [Ganoderma leucocontextum]|nr:hypothetical protein LXA43DRAFT_429160 [Ganoderma leucocontextum]
MIWLDQELSTQWTARPSTEFLGSWSGLEPVNGMSAAAGVTQTQKLVFNDPTTTGHARSTISLLVPRDSEGRCSRDHLRGHDDQSPLGKDIQGLGRTDAGIARQHCLPVAPRVLARQRTPRIVRWRGPKHGAPTPPGRQQRDGHLRVLLAQSAVPRLGADYKCRVWNVEPETLPKELTDRSVLPSAGAFDDYVATASDDDGGVRIWNVETGEDLVMLHRHRGLVRFVSFSTGRREAHPVWADAEGFRLVAEGETTRT